MPAMIRTFFTLFFLLPSAALAQMAPIIMTTKPAAPAEVRVASPVVLELFTSQGCSFCPPADELMGEMIKQPSIIGISCHVDYFGVQKNNLGRGFCTRRQTDYNRMMSDGPRYTPQLVVNGRSHHIGYEGNKISAAIMKARAHKVIPIILNPAPQEGYYYFNLPAMDHANGNLRLGMFVIAAAKKMVMTEGSNFGKSVSYYNVADRFEDLGVWDGLKATRTINANYGPADAGIAVIVQNIATGQIVAAGQAPK